MTFVRRNTTTGKDEFSFGVFRNNSGTPQAIVKHQRTPASPRADWSTVRVGFERGRFETYSGQGIVGEFSAPDGLFRKAPEQLDFGGNTRHTVLTLPTNALNFTGDHTVEFTVRCNNPLMIGVFALLAQGTPTSTSNGLIIYAQNYQPGANPDDWNIHICTADGGIGIWNNVFSVTDMRNEGWQTGQPLRCALQFDKTNNIVIGHINGNWKRNTTLNTTISGRSSISWANPALFIGKYSQNMNYNIQAVMANIAPRGQGFTIWDVEFSDGLKYGTSNYVPRTRLNRDDISRFDPYFNDCVLYYDGWVTPNEMKDLTGRHVFTPTGTAGVNNGKTTKLNNANYFQVLDNLSDFAFGTAGTNTPPNLRVDLAWVGYYTGDTSKLFTMSFGCDANDQWASLIRMYVQKFDTQAPEIGLSTPPNVMLADVAAESADWNFVFPLATDRFINFTTFALINGFWHSYNNGRLVRKSTTSIGTRDQLWLAYDLARPLMIGGKLGVNNNDRCDTEFYGIRVYKNSTGGIVENQLSIPIEWGLMRNA